jgi:hypothetical protein
MNSGYRLARTYIAAQFDRRLGANPANGNLDPQQSARAETIEARNLRTS